MAELTDAAIDAATSRGEAGHANEPRAEAARFDARRRHIVLRLTNGATVAIPSRLLEGLEEATDAQLADVTLLGDGYGLHWEQLDVDFTVPGLLAGIFGTKAYMARRAGQTRSKAKAAAARRNGTKGGRPRKQPAA